MLNSCWSWVGSPFTPSHLPTPFLRTNALTLLHTLQFHLLLHAFILVVVYHFIGHHYRPSPWVFMLLTIPFAIHSFACPFSINQTSPIPLSHSVFCLYKITHSSISFEPRIHSTLPLTHLPFNAPQPRNSLHNQLHTGSVLPPLHQ